MAWSDRPILAPALGAVAGTAIWMGEFDEGERWLRRAWEVAEAHIDPAAAVLLHMVTGMLHAGRGQHQSALEAFAAAAQAQSLLTGVHILAPRITEWLAATQARLGMPDEARATLTGFSAEPERMGWMPLTTRVQRSAWRRETPPRRWMYSETFRTSTPPAGPAFTLVEAHLLAGIAHLPWAIETPPRPQPRQRSRPPSQIG